ncbi:MAG: Nex18 symbiotically induced protein, partial [Geminicoccaceae bacterium]|nr:Nex18 symbiotically induced protein [Geminicoccaceae bacterium]
MIKLQRCATAAAIAVPLWMITSPAGAGDVIETMQEVSSSGQFEIDAFATAVEAAGLAEVLEGAGPHTIFAPTNEAFQMLEVGGLEPQGSAETPEEQLQSADKDRLSELLKHYIVEGRMPFDQLIEQEKLETLQGTKLDVSAAKGGVLVNKIEVLKPDIMADNGVIHV